MNKSDIVAFVSATSPLSRDHTAAVVDGVFAAIVRSLERGQDVTVGGFGTFHVRERAGRNGRDPRTGAPIKIEARRVVQFRPAKHVREAVV